MAITWTRLGFLGFMIPLAIWALGVSIWGASNYKAMRGVLLLAAVVVWFVGRRLNAAGRNEDGTALHQAFGFPMQWSALLPLGAIALTFN